MSEHPPTRPGADTTQIHTLPADGRDHAMGATCWCHPTVEPPAGGEDTAWRFEHHDVSVGGLAARRPPARFTRAAVARLCLMSLSAGVNVTAAVVFLARGRPHAAAPDLGFAVVLLAASGWEIRRGGRPGKDKP